MFNTGRNIWNATVQDEYKYAKNIEIGHGAVARAKRVRKCGAVVITCEAFDNA